MEKFKAVVIGCGRMGAFTSERVAKCAPKCWFPLSHIEAVITHPELNLVGICDQNETRLDEASRRYGIRNVSPDYRELIRATKPDLVCVATRTSERSEIIEYLLHSQVKALHVEKPLCNSMVQLQKLEHFFLKYDAAITYGAIRRHFKIYKRAKSIVDSGRFGRLVNITINFGEANLFWAHPHSLDLILFFAGSREMISAQAKLSGVEMGTVPEHVVSDPLVQSASIFFEDGLIGNITTAGGMDVVLTCESGQVAVQSDGEYLTVRNLQLDSSYFELPVQVNGPFQDFPQGTYAALCCLVEMINGGGASAEHLRNQLILGQKALFLLVQSHLRKGAVCELEELSRNLVVDGYLGNLRA